MDICDTSLSYVQINKYLNDIAENGYQDRIMKHEQIL